MHVFWRLPFLEDSGPLIFDFANFSTIFLVSVYTGVCRFLKMVFKQIVEDFYLSLTGQWKNNFTEVQVKLHFFETEILPYQTWIILIFAKLGLMISPFAAYISFTSTPAKIRGYMYFGIYNRIFLFIYSLILLIWQPVCLSSVFVIYSQGPARSLSPGLQFMCLWLFLASGLCSNHAIGSELLLLCKLSLLPCKSWYSDTKKFKIVTIFFASIIASSILLFWLTYPDSRQSLQDYLQTYPFLVSFIPPKHSAILAFNLLNPPMTFKIFIIFMVSVILLCLLVFPYLGLTYYISQWQQRKLLTNQTQSIVISLTMGIKIRIAFLIAYLQIPFCCCCVCLYFNFPPHYFSICLCMFSMFPFLDAFVEIIVIKFYRQRVKTILSCCGCSKRRNSVSIWEGWPRRSS